MRYLVACERFFGDAPGGAERIAWELARAVSRRGHEVAYVCEGVGVDFPEHEVVEGVRLVRHRGAGLRPWDPRRLSARIGAAAHAVKRSLGDVRWDVVHAHTPATGLGAFRAVGEHARRITTLHSPAVLEQRFTWGDGSLAGRVKRAVGEPLTKLAERELCDSAHTVSALSSFTIHEMKRIHGARVADRVKRVPWWCEARRTRPRPDAKRTLGWPADRPAVFTLRRLVPRMGLDTLIEAVARLRRPVSVFVAGDGPTRGTLESLASARGVADSVRFLGTLSDDTCALAYEAADVFVLPTRNLECFGIIGLEALARGCPVIAANVGAIPEVLGPVMADWFFAPGNAQDLANKLSQALESPGSLPAEEQLVAHVRQNYSRDAILPAYFAMLGVD